ncbi:MAG: transcriptional repressor LexA [Syntrophothermus sp.]
MKNELTDRQKDILHFIQAFTRQNGYPPTIREIGRQFGISSTFGVKRHLDALEKKGFLSLGSNVSRGITLASLHDDDLPGQNASAALPIESDIYQIPVLGRVAAGNPILAVENIEGTISIDKNLLKRNPECFALRVKGDSMINAGIFEGDLVIIEPGREARNGEIVVALIGDETTVKRFEKNRDEIRLIPENDSYQPITVKFREDFSIIGKVIGIQRWYN